MAEPTRTIAILVANPALSSILSMVIASVPGYRVRPFESELALQIYMRLAPVELVVTDFDAENARADLVTRDLRADPGLEQPNFQVIALASSVTPETKTLCIAAGIDEVIVKPMSPKYLLERIISRLARRAAQRAGYRPPRRPATVLRPDFARHGNVIQLFGRPPVPQH